MKTMRTLLNVGSVIILMLMMMLKNHCYITEKYRDSAHRDCNINVKSQSYCIPQPKESSLTSY